MSNENKPMEVILKETPDIDISFETVVYQGTTIIENNSLIDTVKLPGVNTQNSFFYSQEAPLLFKGDRSIEILFKVNDLNKSYTIYSTINNNITGVTIQTISNSTLRVTIGGVRCLEYLINIGDIYHVVITVNGLTAKLYINGTLWDNISFISIANPNMNILGAITYTGTPILFPGTIYLNRTFNYALSAEEVSTLWNNGNPAGYVMPSYQKNIGMNYLSDFSEGADGWIAATTSTVITVNDSVLELTSTSNEYRIRRTTKNKPTDYSCYKIKIELSEPTVVVCTIQFYIWSQNDGIYLGNVPVGTTIIEAYFVPDKFSSLTENSYLYFIPEGSNTQVFKVKEIEVVPIYCVAEYLPGNITSSQWVDSSGNNLDLTAVGTPNLVNYNILPTYYPTREDVENEIKLKAKRDIVAAGNNISNNQLMVINDESSITISCDNLEDGATADIRAKGNTIITFTDSNREIRYIKSYDTIDAASTDIVIYSLMCSNDEVYITRAIF